MDKEGNVVKRYSSTEAIEQLKNKLAVSERKYKDMCIHRNNCERSNTWYAGQLANCKDALKLVSIIFSVALAISWFVIYALVKS